MRFEDFYSNTQQSKQIKNLQESKVFHKLTPNDAYDMAIDLFVKNEPIPKELEKIIITDPYTAYYYAKHIIKGRFPQGESRIMSNYDTTGYYIRFLKKIGYEDVEESFENFFNSTINESFIPDDPEEAYELAKNYKYANKQIPEELENVLAESPKYSYMYAKYILGDKPFPKGEPVIIQSYTYALDYARKVLKGRFPLGEELLSKDPDFAYLYARDVIKGRFPEGEEAIMSLYHTKNDYIKFLKYIGYEDVEESAFTKDTLVSILDVVGELMHKNLPVPDKMINAIASDAFASHIYARDIIEKPFPEGEKAIAKDGYWSYYYAREVMHGRFPEGEEAIFRSMYKDDYLDYLREINYQDLEESFELYFTESNVAPEQGVVKGFLNEASSDEAWELVGQPVPEIQQFVKQMGYGNDKQSVEKITQIIDSAKSSQIPFVNIPKLKNFANKGNDTQTLKAILKISDKPDAEQQYVKLMKARDASEGRERDITGYIQYVKSGNYDPPVLLKLPTGLYVVGGRTRLYAALALGVPATVKILSADNFKQGKVGWKSSLNHQDVEESFEQFFTEAKRKVRKPNKLERTNPLSAAIYASEVVQGRVPELEPLILTEPTAIAQYIWFAIKGRWKEAEETIANIKPSVTTLYALEILKDRWINIPDIPKEIALQAEENIKNSPGTAAYYATDIIKGRWPEAEETILSEPDSKEDYINFLKSINYQDVEESFELYFTEANVRPPTEIEKKDFVSGLFYAKNVLHGRWPELEQKLLNLGSAAVLSLYTYAKEVIKDRWPEAEPFIIDAGTVAPDYARDVIKGRWPELEKSLLENIDFYGEEIDEFTLEVIMYYIYEVVKGRWEEVEPYILQYNNFKKDYIDFLNELNYQDLEESHRSGKRLA